MGGVPVRLRVRRGRPLAHTRVRALSTTCIAVCGTTVREVEGGLTVDAGTARLRVPLGDWVSALDDDADLCPSPAITPLDGVDMPGLDQVVTTAVTTVDAGGAALSTTDAHDLTTSTITRTAWAVETSVVWAVPYDDAPADRYSRPQVIQVLSVGPGEVPAGAQVLATVSDSAVGRLSTARVVDPAGSDVPVDEQWATDGSTGTLVVALGTAPGPCR